MYQLLLLHCSLKEWIQPNFGAGRECIDSRRALGTAGIGDSGFGEYRSLVVPDAHAARRCRLRDIVHPPLVARTKLRQRVWNMDWAYGA